MRKLYFTAFLAILILAGCKETYVKVNEGTFTLDEKPYYFMGTNFWYGLNLGSKGPGGDRARLIRELDRLQAMGVTNLRIMGGSEGPDDEPFRMLPSLQPAPGVYNEEVLDGLDFLLVEMGKRNMYAVVCLNNFWNWSGGFGQYIVWSGKADTIPYPPPAPNGDWNVYQSFAASFYTNDKAVELFNNHISFIVNRKNTYSGKAYKDDPAIMAWELANEPRGIDNMEAYRQWIDSTSGYIKSLDANHLVTTGSEGNTSNVYAGTNLALDHTSPAIDYTTMHIWVQNWGVYDPQKADSTLDLSIAYAKNYMAEHAAMAKTLGKPIVLEEFGISRDLNNHDPAAPVTARDLYYKAVFDEIYQLANKDSSVVAGVNFWAWGGEGRPTENEGLWHAGDDFIGDPPHEFQGWYSVYDHDASTQSIISDYAKKMTSIIKK
ncbi:MULTISPECIES: cellulase family glycosylhydrolase [unclassified Imperialibacter]|uniref:glycoside hydrolase 5 family protein n=1 Tax=unclassified Imperialibacter TaxID=2629706 RepID=UPI001252B51F|nr:MULTISPECIES: cellulase family glycosylhydrolase [unclassified Imperialibacter]CAD5258866.1 Mannan endo-1,4-beta-mannosidase [Imperialibacter sp. 89]CAD5265813.1 Mannan endo-1,4-beta-mannosidase [Imperialibacter sp. 75]VVT21371.1 Mannan endo-1,4-beta-mannosidase [Imperialibacter sp. EC-SDR9]